MSRPRHFYTGCMLPTEWRPLLAIERLPRATPRAPIREDGEAKNRDPTPYRDDQRTVVADFAEGPDCVWADVRLTSGDDSYYIEAVLFDDGHDVDVATTDGADTIELHDGDDTYTVFVLWEDDHDLSSALGRVMTPAEREWGKVYEHFAQQRTGRMLATIDRLLAAIPPHRKNPSGSHRGPSRSISLRERRRLRKKRNRRCGKLKAVPRVR